MTQTTGQPDADAARLTAPVETVLARVGSRARAVLVLQRAADGLASILVVLTLLVVIDYALRLPWGVRLLHWGVGLSALAWATHRNLLPAFRLRPAVTELALRLERLDPARNAGLADRLAATLELTRHGPALGAITPEALDAEARDIARRFKGVRAQAALLRTGRLKHALLIMMVAAVPAAFFSWNSPHLARIGAVRALAPWAGVSWPKRTTVLDGTLLSAHPLGSALPLRALVTTQHGNPSNADVRVSYRVIGPSGDGPIRTVLLTPQGPVDEATADAAGGVSGMILFERLIEPSTLAQSGAQPDQARVEYWFGSGDDQTRPASITLVDPPAVVAARTTITPPQYAVALLSPDRDPVVGERMLGLGRDEKSVVGPILAGSRVDLHLELNKELPVDEGASRQEWLSRVFALSAPPEDLQTEFQGRSWRLSFTLKESIRLPVRLTDRFGVPNTDEIVYRFDAVADQPPAATVVAPARDESVVSTAVVDAAVEGRDDVGLWSVALQIQRHRPDPTSASRSPQPAEDPFSVADVTPIKAAPTGSPELRTKGRAESRLDLSKLAVGPGDEIWITSVAEDTYADVKGARPPTRSSARRLRIISESELVEQVRADLGVVRRAAVQLDADQAQAADRARAASNSEQTAEASRRQHELTQRMRAPAEILKEVADRLERNRMADDAMRRMVADASQTLDRAGERADQAARALEQAARQPGEQSTADRDRAAGNQQAVRDELGKLIEMLDQGQDAWLARRSLERLLNEQRQVSAQTRQAAEQTAGRSLDQLTAQQRNELDRAAQQQRELAQRTEASMQDLRDRADRLNRSDPSQSQALRQAAEQARQSQLADRQRQAADQAQQNQLGNAQQLQQQAEQVLEQMLRELEQAARRRDEVLSRMLSGVVQSLAQLIEGQEGELRVLAEAVRAGNPTGLDPGMRRLHTNTLAVIDQIKAERELAAIAEQVRPAADAQALAVTHLRASPVDADQADQAERVSLEKLKAAKAEAERLLQEASKRDQNRKRTELRDAYQKALGEQEAIRDAAAPLIGQEMGRRERAAARELGERTDALRATLKSILESTQGLADAKLFEFAHRRLDRAAESAATPLKDGEATPAVARAQASVVTVLKSLIDALKDDNREEPFRDANQGGSNQGGGGSGQQQGVVPPVAELKLLRLMQIEIADRTRAADQAKDATEIDELAALQRELAARGKELIERMQEQNTQRPPAQPGVPPAPGGER